jgi:ABC-type transport system involved in multi-copper enzyme maturation permease subunit
MSSATEALGAQTGETERQWSHWLRQTLAITRLESGRSLSGKRAILLYLLALLPVLIMAALALFGTENSTTRTILDAQGNIISQSTKIRTGPMQDPGMASLIFAGIFEGLIVRTVLFFGCAWIFMNLFRGDIVDRSLHYYFLAPVRREVLVIGKYLSGLVTSIVLFACCTASSLFFLYCARGYSASLQFIFAGPGLRQIIWYLAITILGCIGYGAFFLLIGLRFRNPIIPALLIYGWEWLNFLLPPFLKKISVIHYLSSLAPVPIAKGNFAIVAEPTPAVLAVPGLLVITGVILVLSCIEARRMEINYGSD